MQIPISTFGNLYVLDNPMKLNNVRFVKSMHKDVLEFFIIANSVPILHLYQTLDSDADSVLRAGRISAQDILGEETTGELIQKEVLSDSTIYYGRCDEILVALRVTSSMSDSGTQKLLQRSLKLVEDYRELIFRSFGDKATLNPLTKRLNILLGNKFPTNPVIMAKINQIMDEAMNDLDFVDRLALLTSEGWMVNINENESHPIGKVAKYVWRNAVEMLHLSLGLENELVMVLDEESLWFVYPIYFADPLASSGTSWWAFIVQAGRIAVNNKQKSLETIRKTIEERLLDTITPLLVKMLEKESRNFGLTGPLGRLFSLPEYMDNEILQIKTFDQKLQLISENQDGFKLLKEVDFPISNILEILLQDFMEDHRSAVFSFFPKPLFSKICCEVVESLTPNCNVVISFGALDEEKKNSMLEILKKKDVPIKVLVDELMKAIPENNIQPVIISSEAEITNYFLVLKKNESGSLLILSTKDISGNYFSLISTNSEFIELVGNQIDQLELM